MPCALPGHCDAPPAAAQAHESPAPPAAAKPPERLQAGDLNQLPALQVKVSFEVRRYPLKDLLADLQKTSGVALSYAPDPALDALRLTAHMQEVPLAAVMSGLSRLYGVTWTHGPNNSYLMAASDRSDLEKQLIKLGDLQGLRARRRVAGHDRQAAFLDEITNEVDPQVLRAPDGVPLTTLPPELQQQVKQYLLDRIAFQLVGGFYLATEASVLDDTLQLATPRGTIPTSAGAVPYPPQVSVSLPDHSTNVSITALGVPPLPNSKPQPQPQAPAPGNR